MDLQQVAKDYEAATKSFLDAVASFPKADLDKAKKDGWNARQIIHHLADSESQSCARLRRLIAEPGTTIQGYDENKWAGSDVLGYKELPIESSLALFKASRDASLTIIKRLTPDLLNNTGTHTESGEYTVKKWLDGYTRHPKDHAEQLLAD
ncbi:unannotated protein [freshwater metagenome]|uniref:Unannotated protein n=1 Tax=freshwater metagenome TaxID=449393 RepID=A0A6J5Z893_9ZZZZ|nr:hypothetical protein [Actinomycetota bacterium]